MAVHWAPVGSNQVGSQIKGETLFQRENFYRALTTITGPPQEDVCGRQGRVKAGI
jgi:hypothetical protein